MQNKTLKYDIFQCNTFVSTLNYSVYKTNFNTNFITIKRNKLYNKF